MSMIALIMMPTIPRPVCSLLCPLCPLCLPGSAWTVQIRTRANNDTIAKESFISFITAYIIKVLTVHGIE